LARRWLAETARATVKSMRWAILALCVLVGCKAADPSAGGGPEVDAGTDGCARVVPTTEAGTCPVVPASGVVCNRNDTASGWCGAADCPTSAGCGGFGAGPGEICFLLCGGNDAGPSRETACVAQGACTTDTDCQGSLPRVCQNCPLSPDGQASQGCAHWTCVEGQCQVAYCPAAVSCQTGQGCPSYYLPPVDRSCGSDTDCVLVEHVASCCSRVQVAVRTSSQGAFVQAEQQCAATHEPYFFSCGCAADFVTNEEGASPGLGQTLAAACVGGTCKAIIAGALQCGSGSCDAGQQCCTSPDPDGGACIYSCATACPVMRDDAGVPFVYGCHP
jgi:hypothetical protein